MSPYGRNKQGSSCDQDSNESSARGDGNILSKSSICHCDETNARTPTASLVGKTTVAGMFCRRIVILPPHNSCTTAKQSHQITRDTNWPHRTGSNAHRPHDRNRPAMAQATILFCSIIITHAINALDAYHGGQSQAAERAHTWKWTNERPVADRC